MLAAPFNTIVSLISALPQLEKSVSRDSFQPDDVLCRCFSPGKTQLIYFGTSFSAGQRAKKEKDDNNRR